MSQQLSNVQISELICTRLSHDLIGNIGVVSNAVELLDDDPESLAEVKPILELSSKVLSARLKFFRLAFGLSNTSISSLEELQTIAQKYLQTIGNKNFPITLQLQIKNIELYKFVLLGIMNFADTFIKGGNICVTENQSGLIFDICSDNSLSIQKLQIQQQVLQGKISEENPAQTAAIVYLQNILEHSGASIKLSFNDKQALMQIS